MDIQIYNTIFDEFKYNMENFCDYHVAVEHYEPLSPQYPLVILKEIRNNPYGTNRGLLERVSSLGYRIDVFAKTNGEKTHQTIARKIADMSNTFLTWHVGLKQVSMNEERLNTEKDGDLYHVIIIYSADYFENKKRIL